MGQGRAGPGTAARALLAAPDTPDSPVAGDTHDVPSTREAPRAGAPRVRLGATPRSSRRPEGRRALAVTILSVGTIQANGSHVLRPSAGKTLTHEDIPEAACHHTGPPRKRQAPGRQPGLLSRPAPTQDDGACRSASDPSPHHEHRRGPSSPGLWGSGRAAGAAGRERSAWVVCVLSFLPNTGTPREQEL